MTTSQDIIEPFLEKGNSHRFRGHHLGTMHGWRNYLSGEQYFPMARFHPKTTKDEDLFSNMKEISQAVDKFVYLYPDEDTLILCLHNQFTKTDERWQRKFWDDELVQAQIYENWPVDKSIPLEQIPTWIKREFLSYQMMPMFYSQIAWGDRSHFQHKNCHVVKIIDLLYDFAKTLIDLKDFFGFSFVKPLTSLSPIHKKMLSLQLNLDIDNTCKKIVDSVNKPKHFLWDPLPLVGEAWVQWQLRQMGYQICCHGLDIFPCDSVNLQKIIYKS